MGRSKGTSRAPRDSDVAAVDGRDRDPGTARDLPSIRQRFLRGSTWLLAGAAAGRALSLVGAIVTTRVLLPRAFGELSYVQAVISFAAGLAVLGLNLAVTKSVAATRTTDPARAGYLIGLALRITGVAGSILAVAMVLFRQEIARVMGGGQLADELALGSVAIAAGCLTAVAVGSLNGMESFQMVALVTSIRSVLSSMLMVAGAIWMGLLGAVGGWAIGESLAAGCAVFVVTRQRRVLGLSSSSTRSRQGWSMLRIVGLPAFIANAAVALALVIGQGLLADQPGGFEEVAQFNVAYRWSLAVLFVPASIAPILLPLLTNLRAERAVSSFLRLLKANVALNVLLTALPAIALIAMSGVVLRLSGPSYAAEPATFVILMIATVPIALNSVMSQAALSLDAVRAWLISDLALAGTLVGVAWLLVDVWGSSGLGLAYALGYVVTCVVLAFPLWNRLQKLRLGR